MNLYMVTTKLPSVITEEFIKLIPRQRAQVNKLMNDGKIMQYSLAMDRSFLWITISAASEQEVMDILSTFPLIHHMKPEINELAFYNSVSTELSKLIMN